NVIYKNLYGSATSGSFQTIQVGLVSEGDVLSFIYKLNNYSSPYAPPAADSGNFVVAVSTDNGATYTDIDTIVNDGVSVGWQTFDYDLSAYAGEYVRIRITAVRTAGDYYLAFDNFYIGQPITCVAPHGLTVSNITHNSAVLNWESDGENFEISWGEGNFDPEDGTIEPFNNGGTLSGLNGSTTLRFSVRQVCGDVVSSCASPTACTTSLASATTSMMEAFATTAIPSGWCTSCFSIGTGSGIAGGARGCNGNVISKNLSASAT